MHCALIVRVTGSEELLPRAMSTPPRHLPQRSFVRRGIDCLLGASFVYGLLLVTTGLRVPDGFRQRVNQILRAIDATPARWRDGVIHCLIRAQASSPSRTTK